MKLIRRQFGPDRPAHTVDWEMLTGTPLQILLSFAFTGNTCIEKKKKLYPKEQFAQKRQGK